MGEIQRDERGYFKKGVSANPAGKKPLSKELKATISELREKHSVEALQTLVSVLQSKSATNHEKIKSAEILLMYTIPKPAQLNLNQNVNVDLIDLAESMAGLSTDELKRLANNTIEVDNG